MFLKLLFLREMGCPQAYFFKLGKVLKNDGLIDYDPSLFQSLRIEAENKQNGMMLSSEWPIFTGNSAAFIQLINIL